MDKAQIFLKVWMREKWGIEPGLVAFPEIKLDLTLKQVCEVMESYKDYCLKVTPAFPCPSCTTTSQVGIGHSVDSQGNFSHSQECPTFNGCAFCGNSPAECECPQPL